MDAVVLQSIAVFCSSRDNKSGFESVLLIACKEAAEPVSCVSAGSDPAAGGLISNIFSTEQRSDSFDGGPKSGNMIKVLYFLLIL